MPCALGTVAATTESILAAADNQRPTTCMSLSYFKFGPQVVKSCLDDLKFSSKLLSQNPRTFSHLKLQVYVYFPLQVSSLPCFNASILLSHSPQSLPSPEHLTFGLPLVLTIMWYVLCTPFQVSRFRFEIYLKFEARITGTNGRSSRENSQ
ncbi:hypothetical protein B0H19DRAFT_1365285 [Mycena capillaripes]|nr:hypothetical protein B0H19DRAFT_1365285 [Mycena capillaripes]